MAGDTSIAIVAWALTYLAHSTALSAAAWLLDRWLLPPGAVRIREAIWKTALLAGLLTSTLQSAGIVHPIAGVARIVGSVPTVANPDAPAARVTSVTRPSSPAETATTVFFGLWIAGAIAAGVRQGLALAELRRSLTGRRPVTRGPLRVSLDRLTSETERPVSVRLTCSRRLRVPVAIGTSEICVPVRALRELDEAELHALVGHELAHVVRRDAWWRLLAVGVESLLVVQPLTRLVRARLRDLAELACDDWAARNAGGRLPLARCLVKVAAWDEPGLGAAWVAPFAARRCCLTERVERLVEAPLTDAGSRWSAIASTVLLVATACAFVPSIAATDSAGPGLRVEAPRPALQPAVPAADRSPIAVASTAPIRRDRDRIPAGRMAPATQRPAEITAAAAAQPASADRSPDAAAAPAVFTETLEREQASARVSPIRDAIAHLVIDEIPASVGREPLFRERTWERKARMWALYERINPSLMPGRPRP